ncbi:MAG: hypothetical protein JJ863_35070 [Deltaproteobacteria bacterium]|nr:hypothetical protein [Deltaproteobacteria bacterium]
MSEQANESAPLSEEALREKVAEILRGIRHERDKWDAGIEELKALFTGPQEGAARHVVEEATRRERLELQWKLEEMLEATAPPPPPGAEKKPEPEPEPEEEVAEDPANRVVAPLRPEDLVPIYEDPRGLLIHEHAIDGRWILTQVDPMTGQPQSMELSGPQRAQVKQELAESPYWVDKKNPSPIIG